MYDVLTTGAVVEELRSTILDGRIQKLGLVSPLAIGAEVYARGRRWHLLASADAVQPRLHLVSTMPSTDPNVVTPFGLQLRKYVRGGFIVDIDQPPLERVIRLSIAKRFAPLNAEGDRDADDAGDEDDIWSGEGVERFQLIIEMMGRHSNIVLVDADGVVRESAKRVNASMSRVRQILPRRPYALPPAPDKPDPRQMTTPTVETVLRAAKSSDRLADVLVRGWRGISPQIGREAAYRTSGDAGGTVGDLGPDAARDIAQTVRTMFQPLITGEWQPHVYERDGLVVGYAALPMAHLAVDADDHEVNSISAAIEQSVDAGEEATPRDHAQRRARLVQSIDQALKSAESRLRSLNQQHERSLDTDRLRRWGEAIYAYLWQIKPGDAELVAETEAGEERIPLDPDKDPKDVAQAYFEEYRKAQRAGSSLPERINAVEHERDYLRQLRVQAEQAEGFAEIESLRHEFEEMANPRFAVQERGGQRASKKQAGRRIAPIIDEAGNVVYIGRSGRENAEVTFDIAGPDDLWLHARGVPGSHVILRPRSGVEDPDPDVVERAAQLAAWYSGSRDSTSVEVDVTERKNVRKIKGAGPGMVTYRGEHTIAVRPSDALEREHAGTT